MQRIFHPVGQGAFFSEKFTETTPAINVVFDCGSTTLNTKFRKAKVNSSFRKGETIDILFISHFHADHINGIEFLMKDRKIKNVVIPYLDDEDKALIKIFNLLEDGFIETGIIDSPETFFGGDARIIRVLPAINNEDGNLGTNDGFNLDRDRPDQAGTSAGQRTYVTVASGTPLRSSQLPFWLFIPYNYKMTARAKPFIDALDRMGLKINDLNSIEKIQINKKLLIKAYESVEGNLNKTSLILYSGPDNISDKESKCYFNYQPVFFPFEPVDHFSGCLYTGDADFNEPDLLPELKKRLSQLSEYIGTLVIPHHGAIGNFIPEILDLAPTLQSAVFSFGKTNSYGHPSDAVISQIVGHNRVIPEPAYWWQEPRNMIIRVTEDAASGAFYKFVL